MTSKDRVTITARIPADLAARIAAEEDRLVVGRSRMVEAALENLLVHTASLPDAAPVGLLRAAPVSADAEPVPVEVVRPDPTMVRRDPPFLPNLGRILGRRRRG